MLRLLLAFPILLGFSGPGWSNFNLLSAEVPEEVAPPSAEVPDNKVTPSADEEELGARGKALFEAIVADDPSLGESFWFPKEPFVTLKAIEAPEKYWAELRRTYARDIHKLHEQRKSWEGARFVRFTLGSTPKWVAPGKEANSIGYYRSFHSTIHYELDGVAKSFDVHTLITWQGRWYVTHLNPFH